MIFQGSRLGGMLTLFLFILYFSYITLLLMDILYIYDKACGVMTCHGEFALIR
jgi:hypothetical protein